MKPILCLLMLGLCVSMNAQTSKKAPKIDPESFNDGYYIDNTGNKVYGLIKYVKGNNARLEYKENADSKKKKLQPGEVKEFWVNHTMKFIRVDNSFNVKIGVWRIDIDDDFLEVVEEGGKLGLYRHYSMHGSGDPKFPSAVDVTNLVAKVDNDFIGLHPNFKKRRKALEELFKDNTELVDIFCEEREKDLIQKIQEYNAKH